MFIVKVKKERCKGCGLCINICPAKIFKVSSNFNNRGCHYIEPDNKEKNNCTGCQRCVIICPDVAIEIIKEQQVEKKGTNDKGAKDEK